MFTGQQRSVHQGVLDAGSALHVSTRRCELRAFVTFSVFCSIEKAGR